jgi:hypothetical protein
VHHIDSLQKLVGLAEQVGGKESLGRAVSKEFVGGWMAVRMLMTGCGDQDGSDASVEESFMQFECGPSQAAALQGFKGLDKMQVPQL